MNEIGCTVKELPEGQQAEAAALAVQYNPANRPRRLGMVLQCKQQQPSPTVARLAVMTTKYWGANGVKLTVGFLDNAPADLKARILQHMNAWGAFANVTFTLTATDPQVRIARANDGYWSYLGTDILGIARDKPTMNLQGFTMNTPESEFHRVVRHETGHTLGFPHEHMRQEIVSRLDVNKTIEYFGRTQGWSPTVVKQQVLTPLSEASIRGTPHADQDSIMAYFLPASITKDGQPVRGGVDIDQLDGDFAGKLYPLAVQPPPPPPPPGATTITLSADMKAGTYKVQ